jgi:hypothetical protein
MSAAELNFFERGETKKVSAFYVVMKALGLVAEQSRVG